MLKRIAQTAGGDHVIRLLQCLSVAIRPLRVGELAEVLALDFDGPEGGSATGAEGSQAVGGSVTGRAVNVLELDHFCRQ